MPMMTCSRMLFASILLLFVCSASASTPVGPMSYQGRLLNANGVPVNEPLGLDFIVRIYDDPTAGNLVYQETHSDVVITDGVYSFKIGTQTPQQGTWDIDLWQNNLNDLYLELEVDGETLSPRQELTSSPHAFTATLALSADVLGNKTAAEYDNILEGICVASKGKWLDLLEECLGAGSIVTGQTIATMVSAGPNQLDFSNLNLTGADLTNTDFSNADFSNTDLTGATITINNFNGANLSGAILDGTVFTDDLLGTTAITFTGATLTNIDIDGWNMSGVTLTNISSGPLLSPGGVNTGCPNSLPADWACRFTQGFGASVTIPILVGPGVNFSAGAALAQASGEGVAVLPIEPNNPLGVNPFSQINLTGANFEGIIHQNKFGGSNLTDAKMSYGVFRNVSFGSATLNGTELRHAVFDGAQFSPSATLTNVDFQNSTLRNTQIGGLITNTDTSVKSFYRTSLYKVVLSQVGQDGSNITFEGSLIDNVKLGFIDGSISFASSTTDGTGAAQIVGNLNIGGQAGGTLSFNHASFDGHLDRITVSGDLSGGSFKSTTIFNVEFSGNFNSADFTDTFKPAAQFKDSILSGDFTSANLSGASFTRGVLSGDFTNANFTGASFNGAVSSIPPPPTTGLLMSGDFTGADFNMTTHLGVTWDNNAICPNGFTYGSGSGNCP